MMTPYEQYQRALAHLASPALFLDLDAFNSNLSWVIENSGKKNIRLATKSIRSVEMIKKILSSSNVFKGLMTYDLNESLWLKEQGFDDILVGYPTMDVLALKKLAKDPKGIVLMLDLFEHIEFLQKLAEENQCHYSICVDLDLSLDLPGLRFGVYRSSIHHLDQLDRFLIKLKDCPRLQLVGAMGYEAQISGLMDKHSPLIRTLKSWSIKQLQKRRSQMIDRIRGFGHHLDFVNGGGTGSLNQTTQESVVTEISVGSAFYAPVLFDHYAHFTLTPAMAFTLPVTRKPQKNIYTCLGGGYIASGATDKIKTPTPYLPSGIKLLKHEGAGETQTPFYYSGKDLSVGNFIIMRHAKAGEICERFSEIHFVQKDKYMGSALTYRGQGKNFI